MLNGNLLNEHRFREAMQLYLECLWVQDLTKLNQVKPNITLLEYRTFWRKKRESTVTSSYGLHVGHYKAVTQSLKILEVHRTLLLIPFKHRNGSMLVAEDSSDYVREGARSSMDT